MPENRRTWRRLLLFVVLLVAIGGLWFVLPPQPRYVLRLRERSAIWGFSPDGTELKTVGLFQKEHSDGLRGPIRFWNINTGRESRAFFTQDDLFGQVWLCQDGRLLVTKRGDDEREVLFDAGTGQPCLDATGWHGCVSRNGRFVAFATSPDSHGEVKVWEVASGHEVGTFGVSDPMDFSPNGASLLTMPVHSKPGPPGYEIKIWDVASVSQQGTLPIRPGAWMFSPDGKTLAIAGSNRGGSIFQLVDVPAGREQARLASCWHPLFIGDGRTLLTLCKDPLIGSCVKSWEVASLEGRIVTKLDRPGYSCFVGTVRPSPNGQVLAVLASYEAPSILAGLTARWRWLADRVPAKHSHSEIKLLDMVSGREIAILPHGGVPCFSPDGTLLALERDRTKIEVWDVPPRKAVGPFVLLSANLSMLMLVIARWRSARRQKANRRANAAATPSTDSCAQPARG